MHINIYKKNLPPPPPQCNKYWVHISECQTPGLTRGSPPQLLYKGEGVNPGLNPGVRVLRFGLCIQYTALYEPAGHALFMHFFNPFHPEERLSYHRSKVERNQSLKGENWKHVLFFIPRGMQSNLNGVCCP
jgi:hypothetical protein